MDPVTMSALINAGSSVLKGAMTAMAPPPPPPQRADGYAMGGMLESNSPNSSSSGSTGGAYGGAFSQSYVDGSNWVVATGKSNAQGGGRSGGNGGLAPILTSSQGGVTPSALAAGAALPKNTMVLIGLAAVAYFLLKR